MNTKQTYLMILIVLIKGLILKKIELDYCNKLSHDKYQDMKKNLKVLEIMTPIEDGEYKIYSNIKLTSEYSGKQGLYTVRKFKLAKNLDIDELNDLLQREFIEVLGEKVIECYSEDYYIQKLLRN